MLGGYFICTENWTYFEKYHREPKRFFGYSINVYLCSCVILSRFENDLNQNKEGLYCGKFKISSCLPLRKYEAPITSQVSIISATIIKCSPIAILGVS